MTEAVGQLISALLHSEGDGDHVFTLVNGKPVRAAERDLSLRMLATQAAGVRSRKCSSTWLTV
jgi:hypothetical protein